MSQLEQTPQENETVSNEAVTDSSSQHNTELASEETTVSESESDTEPLASDESNTDESDHNNNDETETVSYEGKTVEELLHLAVEATQNSTPREAYKRLQQIRTVFNDQLRAEKREALQKHIDADGDPEAFEYSDEEYRERFKAAFNMAKNVRQEERERIEKEKLKNLKLKEALLEKLRAITESDETEESLNEVKAIQQEWKAIRVVPQDKVQELWDAYHYLLDKFYDNHSINIELKELDRKKNLEVKIELCKKVDELSSESSLKSSFILLNKYQEEFRNTGPVPREFNKEIWERFRAACDKIYEEKKAVFDKLEEKRQQNLELKQVLVEKAELLIATLPKKLKEWNSVGGELDKLMTEWKKIGHAPKAQNDAIWKAFRKPFNTFYEAKSEFFKQLNKERKANLILKEDICKRAEEVKDSDDLNFATKELKKLQREWKEIGPVPDKVSTAIWKRFRAACDEFFNKKQKAFEGRKEEEQQNLEAKQKLIDELNELSKSEKKDAILEELKRIQQSWNQIGFVPFKSKKSIEEKYKKASDVVFNKFKLDKQSVKEGQMQSHYENLALLPAGKQKLKDEAFRVQKKIRFLESEISTLENNMEFFGRSKGAQKLKDEIAAKIDKTKGQIKRLKGELKVIRGVKFEQTTPQS